MQQISIPGTCELLPLMRLAAFSEAVFTWQYELLRQTHWNSRSTWLLLTAFSHLSSAGVGVKFNEAIPLFLAAEWVDDGDRVVIDVYAVVLGNRWSTHRCQSLLLEFLSCCQFLLATVTDLGVNDIFLMAKQVHSKALQDTCNCGTWLWQDCIWNHAAQMASGRTVANKTAWFLCWFCWCRCSLHLVQKCAWWYWVVAEIRKKKIW